MEYLLLDSCLILYMLYFFAFVIFLTSLSLLIDISVYLPSFWFIPFIFLFGISFFIFVDWVSSFVNDRKEKEYDKNKKKRDKLLKIQYESKDSLVLISKESKLENYYPLLIGALVFTPILLIHYYLDNERIAESLFTSAAAIFILLSAKYIFNIKDKREKLTIDLSDGIFTIKSYISNSESYIPLSRIKRIVIKSYKKQQKHNIFYTNFYSISIQFRDNNGLNKTRLIEHSKDKLWTKHLVEKLWFYLNVNILDLSALKLSKPAFSKQNNTDKADREITYSNLLHNKSDNSFIWKAKENSSVLLFEFSLFFLCLEAIIYSITFFSFDTIPSTLIILFIMLIFLILFITRHYVRKERFIFGESNIIYQELLGKTLIKEKNLSLREVKNIHFLFSNVILSDNNNYIIGDLHSLSNAEILFLRTKLLDREDS